MDGADAPASFSRSRESGWAALPARPAALRRNPAFQDRVFHFVTALQVRLSAAGLLVASCRPPQLSGAGCGRFGAMEVVMLHENSRVLDSGKGRAAKTKRTSRAARKTRQGGNGAQRASLYDEVTAQIIAQLEEGIFPWMKPWHAGNAVTGLPRNAISGRHYSGINILILWGAVIDGGYPSQDWLTFRQALAAGGCVRKGEKGRTIFYADRFTPDDERNHEGEGDAPRSIPFLKRFTVFNAAQCDGLPERLIAEPAPLPERELHDQAEALINATGADFRTGGTKAYYSPAEDYVQVPPQPAFTHQIDYYRTALHELGHNAVTGIMPHRIEERRLSV